MAWGIARKHCKYQPFGLQRVKKKVNSGVWLKQLSKNASNRCSLGVLLEHFFLGACTAATLSKSLAKTTCLAVSLKRMVWGVARKQLNISV